MTSIFSRVALAIFLLFATNVLVASGSSTRPCPNRTSDEYYFAKGGLTTNGIEDDQFRRKWYSRHLRAMSEPSLSCGQFASEETYRFTWLRTFHHPITIKITRTSIQIVVEAMELSGAGGYNPGSAKRQSKKLLKPFQWEELLSAVEKSNVWNEPVNKPILVMDGAQWIFEARQGSGYRVFDHSTPYDEAIRNLGLTFLKLAGWTVPEREIY